MEAAQDWFSCQQGLGITRDVFQYLPMDTGRAGNRDLASVNFLHFRLAP